MLAGPFGAAIDGLTLVDVVGSSELDFVFAAGDRVHIVDGTTLEPVWISGVLGSGVGA